MTMRAGSDGAVRRPFCRVQLGDKGDGGVPYLCVAVLCQFCLLAALFRSPAIADFMATQGSIGPFEIALPARRRARSGRILTPRLLRAWRLTTGTQLLVPWPLAIHQEVGEGKVEIPLHGVAKEEQVTAAQALAHSGHGWADQIAVCRGVHIAVPLRETPAARGARAGIAPPARRHGAVL